MQRTILLVVLVTVASWLNTAPVGAAAVIDVDPRPGSVVYQPLDTIRLTFDGPINPRSDSFSVVDDRSEPVTFTATVTPADGGTEVTLTFEPPLSSGRYRLEWEIADGQGAATGVVPFEVVVDGVPTTPESDEPSGLPAALPLPHDNPETVDPLAAIRSSLSDELGWTSFATAAALLRGLSSLVLLGLVVAFIVPLRARPDEIAQLVTLFRLVADLGAVASIASITLTPGGLASWAGGDGVVVASLALGSIAALGFAVAVLIEPRRGLVPTAPTEHAPAAGRLIASSPSRTSDHITLPASSGPRTETWRFDPTACPRALTGVVLVALSVAGHAVITTGVGLRVGLTLAITLLAGAAWLGSCICTVTVLLRRADAGLALDPASLLVAGRRWLVVAIAAASIAGAVVTANLDGVVPAAWLAIAVTSGPTAVAAALVDRSVVPRATASGRPGPAALARLTTGIEPVTLTLTLAALQLALS